MRILSVLASFLSVVFATAPEAQNGSARPFEVGEHAIYKVSYLFASGSASMTVVGIDTVRGRGAYHFRFVMSGRAAGLYSLQDTLDSWVDTATFHTLRFHQNQIENGRTRAHEYEIFADRQVFSDFGRELQPSVAAPLDDVSLLYFVRGVDLVPGQTRELHRYFKPASNPVLLRVIGRDTITVEAGRYPAIVVQPIIKSRSGLFTEAAGARVWFSDDSARIVLQIKARMPAFGTLTMQLRSYRAR